MRLGLCPNACSISGIHSHCPSCNSVICLPGLLGLWITYPWCRVLGLEVHGVSGTERLKDQRKEAQECQDRKWSWPVFPRNRPEYETGVSTGLGCFLEPEPEVLPTAFRKKEAFLILISGRRPTHQALGAQPLLSQSVN